MACDVQELMDEAVCYDCLPSSTKLTLELALLNRLAGGVALDELIAEIPCYDCRTSATKSTMELALLCRWFESL